MAKNFLNDGAHAKYNFLMLNHLEKIQISGILMPT